MKVYRYDISYAVSRLSQYMAKPTVGAELAMQRVLSYLKTNPSLALVANLNMHDDIQVYSDSDHGGDGSIARSHTSYIMLLNGAPIHWRSVKQPCTSLSSACAEIYALSDACKDARLMQWRAEELGLNVSWPVVVQVDNKQAQSFQQGTCVQTKIRGTFDMRESWVQELKDKAQVQVEHVPGVQNCADLMSKAHRTPRFQLLLHWYTMLRVIKQVIKVGC